ncbi:ferrous iron transport protein B [Cytophaga hutchinsonii]|uniref:Ferrous iron transport protein B n=1 Tax=Cytophaga hutchinsonii (strain ATCC 33406 / DSM 1761 / CIP 103989 / NBRC 15051 / NCIMB 9469 / D465) TaxID=269798 RepID=A0A6N4SXB5_CYTH3|nr:ferrous iron transport protein B [Cytophaga hutchinsonii]ABG60959.1 ferrous iron transport protein B [Cytophaga hutchinsonii ATCC 33406]SFX43241.1 ferrous iron transport protein B [Cytophaga hutchinsonii ATCC 33406]
MKRVKVALIGNPNAGKSSLFNYLTGLNQKIGNFPGVTVDKKTGISTLSPTVQADIIDLPGTYSIYPRSLDEQVVFDYLTETMRGETPDILVVVIDASNFKRNLLLFTQVKDLGFPVILALNMLDLAEKSGISFDLIKIQQELKVPVVAVNARTGKGIDALKAALVCPVHVAADSFYKSSEVAGPVVSHIRERFKIDSDYMALLLAHLHKKTTILTEEEKKEISEVVEKNHLQSNSLQYRETLARYEAIHTVIHKVMSEDARQGKIRWSKKIDQVVTHKVWGYVLFFVVLFLIFQTIFAWSEMPMEWIDRAFGSLKGIVSGYMPDGYLKDFINEGIISGLQGVLIFIPQITFLFAFIAILEESGYMSRVMFMMDKIMRKFGLSGRSVVPLISGVACAVPAIMATRSIETWKERLITIMVTPLMSCSARLPVFTVLIGLMIPESSVLGIFNMQGVALMGFYLLGFVMAIISAWFMQLILKGKGKSYFIMEFPTYKFPRFKNVATSIIEKVKTFVFEAGKIILAISVILWVLATYGPKSAMEEAENNPMLTTLQGGEYETQLSSLKLEASYAGHFGKFIEPVIKPLGFDWKIGIALITSFAAREVFVGTMATIYSVGNTEDELSVRDSMKSQVDAEGQPYYTVARAGSLLLFYLFAMQCMSTIAVVYRETKGWKWPLIQLGYMTFLAYTSSFIFFQLLK